MALGFPSIWIMVAITWKIRKYLLQDIIAQRVDSEFDEIAMVFPIKMA